MHVQAVKHRIAQSSVVLKLGQHWNHLGSFKNTEILIGWLGVEPGHWDFFKVPQGIPLCSQDGEYLF